MTLSNNIGDNVYNAYVIAQVNTGTYDMDATGTTFTQACVIWNANFAALFAAAGGTAQVINVSTAINNQQGDNAYVVFTKCNANFTVLFALAGISGSLQLVNVGPGGAYNGIIGLGDPGVLACIKVNENFALLQ